MELEYRLKKIIADNRIGADRDPRGGRIHHAAWMLNNLPQDSSDKYNRWIGYIQALMIIHGLITLVEMRDLTRESTV